MGKVIVRINEKTGETTYEVNGVVGTACENVTAAFVRSNEEVDKGYTEEFNEVQELPDYLSEGE